MDAGNGADRPGWRDLADHGAQHPAARTNRSEVTAGLSEIDRPAGRNNDAAGKVEFGAVGGTAVAGQSGCAGAGDDAKSSRWRPFENFVMTAIRDVEAAAVRDRQVVRLIWCQLDSRGSAFERDMRTKPGRGRNCNGHEDEDEERLSHGTIFAPLLVVDMVSPNNDAGTR